MNLLEIFEENNKRKEEEERQNDKRAFNKEIREIKSEIILGEEKHYSDNKELLEKLKIKYKKIETTSFGLYYSKRYDYYFEYNKTNVAKIQKYLDQEA